MWVRLQLSLTQSSLCFCNRHICYLLTDCCGWITILKVSPNPKKSAACTLNFTCKYLYGCVSSWLEIHGVEFSHLLWRHCGEDYEWKHIFGDQWYIFFNSYYENVNFKCAKSRFTCKKRKGNNSIPLRVFGVPKLNAELVTRAQSSWIIQPPS